MTPDTLNQLFLAAIPGFVHRAAALRVKRDGAWRPITYRELFERVRATSLGFRTIGGQPGDRVAILSENRPEWAFTDYACLALGAADVPVYPTLPAKQVAYILRDSGAKVVCVSTKAQLAKLDSMPRQEEVPALEAGSYFFRCDVHRDMNGTLVAR